MNGMLKKATKRRDKGVQDSMGWDEEPVRAQVASLDTVFDALTKTVQEAVDLDAGLVELEEVDAAQEQLDALHRCDALASKHHADLNEALGVLARLVSESKTARRNAEKAEAAALKEAKKSIAALGRKAQKVGTGLKEQWAAFEHALADDGLDSAWSDALRASIEEKYNALLEQGAQLEQALADLGDNDTATAAAALRQQGEQGLTDFEDARRVPSGVGRRTRRS